MRRKNVFRFPLITQLINSYQRRGVSRHSSMGCLWRKLNRTYSRVYATWLIVKQGNACHSPPTFYIFHYNSMHSPPSVNLPWRRQQRRGGPDVPSTRHLTTPQVYSECENSKCQRHASLGCLQKGKMHWERRALVMTNKSTT